MNLCKTCKWWQPTDDEYDSLVYPIDEDTFERKKMLFVVQVCQSPNLLFIERPVTDTQATLQDGSDYTARMITAPNFGCVNHEA